ncbi:MAG: DUF3617 family protein [Burkholderiales bacterium]|nr:DUF3617 family protein [Burkholderiales bacterium]
MRRCLFLLAIAFTALPAGAQMLPGQWSLAMTMEANGRKQVFPAVVDCITQADIDDATRTLPRPAGKCTLTNVERTPERATYDLACINGTLQSQGRADIVFEPERYYGNVSMAMTGRGAPAQMVLISVVARRTGACQK